MCPYLVFLVVASSAQPESGGLSPYQVDAFVDTVLVVGLGAGLASTSTLRKSMPYQPSCDPCDRDDLFDLDRYALGKHSRGWLRLSDGAETASLVLPYALDALDVLLSDSPNRWADLGTDLVVILEAQLAAGMVISLVKPTVGRPRPRQYDPDTFKAVRTSYESFPSGHALAIATGASAYALTFWLRHPTSHWRFVVAGLAGALTLVGAWARVESGQHFPTDVLAGAAIGSMVGLLIPWLHRRDSGASVTVAPMAGGGTVGLAWQL